MSGSTSLIDSDDIFDSSSIDKKQAEIMTTEQTPLLRSRSPSVGEVVDTAESKKTMAPRTIIIIILIILVLVQLGDQLMEPSFTRVFESIYCYNYWETEDPSKILLSRANVRPGAVGGVAEDFCKVARVQSQVATLRGYQYLFDGLPSLFLAVPFGIMADKFGRKLVLIPVMCSFPIKGAIVQIVCWYWQSFDIRMSWISSVTALFGGGSGVASALYYCVISDVTNVSERASLFFAMSACALIANFLGYPTAAYLLRSGDPWLALLLGLALMAIPIPLLLIIPETLNYKHPHLEPRAKAPTQQDPSGSTTTTLFKTCNTLLKEATHFILADWRIASLTATFILHYLSMSTATVTLVQYISYRYAVSISYATLLLSIRAACMLLILLLFLPFVSHLMLFRNGYSSQQKDLILARASAAATAVGFGLVALAPSIGLFVPAMVVLTLGAGFVALVRSFLTSLVKASDVAKLYTVISAVDTLGLMTGSPALALLFEVGMGIGGAGLGLPLWVLGGLYGVVFGVLVLVGIRETDGSVEAGEGGIVDEEDDGVIG